MSGRTPAGVGATFFTLRAGHRGSHRILAYHRPSSRIRLGVGENIPGDYTADAKSVRHPSHVP